jgi:hypothetical protein
MPRLRTEMLPPTIKCPHCSAKMDLDEQERVTRLFDCPACMKRIDLTTEHQSADPGSRQDQASAGSVVPTWESSSTIEQIGTRVTNESSHGSVLPEHGVAKLYPDKTIDDLIKLYEKRSEESLSGVEVQLLKDELKNRGFIVNSWGEVVQKPKSEATLETSPREITSHSDRPSINPAKMSLSHRSPTGKSLVPLLNAIRPNKLIVIGGVPFLVGFLLKSIYGEIPWVSTEKKIESVEDAKRVAPGIWVGKEESQGPTFWMRLVLKGDGTYDMYYKVANEDSWGTPTNMGKWSIGTSKYVDSGERFYFVQLDDRVASENDDQKSVEEMINERAAELRSGRIRLGVQTAIVRDETHLEYRGTGATQWVVKLDKGDRFPFAK